MVPLQGKSKRSLVWFAAVVSLAACASGVTVSGHRNISGSYRVSELYVVATGDNELRTVIVGNPFEMPTADFETAVLKSMMGRNLGPTLNLSTNPRQEDPRKRHVVIAFNLRNIFDADAICRGEAEALEVQPPAERFTVSGAYCAGTLPLTQATAWLGEVTAMDSPQFDSLMGQLMIALFPARDRRRNDSQD